MEHYSNLIFKYTREKRALLGVQFPCLPVKVHQDRMKSGLFPLLVAPWLTQVFSSGGRSFTVSSPSAPNANLYLQLTNCFLEHK